MGPTDSFDDLMARLRGSDNDAAAGMVRRFTRRLIALARTHLDDRLRQKVDPEDIVQSVYKSFFARHTRGEFDLDGWDGLWALLALLTVRKCCRRAKRFHTARRDVRREGTPAGDDAAAGWDALDREPTPDEAAALVEAVEQLLAGLGDRDREIAALCLDGSGSPEVAARLNCSTRTVERVRKRIRDRLERGADGDV